MFLALFIAMAGGLLPVHLVAGESGEDKAVSTSAELSNSSKPPKLTIRKTKLRWRVASESPTKLLGTAAPTFKQVKFESTKTNLAALSDGPALVASKPAKPVWRSALEKVSRDESDEKETNTSETAETLPDPDGKSDDNETPPSHVPSLQDELAQGQAAEEDDCKRLQHAKRLDAIALDLAPSKGELPPDCLLEGGQFEPRNWCCTEYFWKASSLCHKPLYFEEVSLERYGHSWGPYCQPFISGGHFFGNVLLMPYHMGIEPCCECIYPLGYYRPGSCAPYMIGPVPISLRGGLFQAATVVGGVAVFP